VVKEDATTPKFRGLKVRGLNKSNSHWEWTASDPSILRYPAAPRVMKVSDHLPPQRWGGCQGSPSELDVAEDRGRRRPSVLGKGGIAVDMYLMHI